MVKAKPPPFYFMDLIITIVVLVYSVILHELSHGLVAGWLGDHTARHEGRMTLNPIPHIDPLMTIALPLLLYLTQLGVPADHRVIFGGAKGVPVDPRNFKDPKIDMALVSFAGPLTNFLLASVAALLIKTPLAQSDLGYSILASVVVINIVLTVFNLVPIPPMDGSKVLAAFMPTELAYKFLSIERFGYILIFLFLYLHLFDAILQNFVALFLRLFHLS